MSIPYIFNIQRYALHDGPGIRTTIFFKGCPLHCLWCCNPESQNPKPEIYFEENKCISCLSCERVCREEIHLSDRLFHTSVCNKCIPKSCLQICPSGAISVLGEKYSIESLMEIVRKDKIFYQEINGGGVTVSGGEPLLYPKYLKAFLEACHEENIPTAIETCLYVSKANLLTVMNHIDYFYCDLKHWNNVAFKKWTGGDLTTILNNLKLLTENDKDILARVPIIPDFNDSTDDIEKICILLKDIGIKKMSLLPYHRLGKVKYLRLGKKYSLDHLDVPSMEKMMSLKSIPSMFNIDIV